MKYWIILLLLCCGSLLTAQKVNPVITTTGGIYEIPEATVLPDPELDYKVVVDLFSGGVEPDSLGRGLYLVARMMNLFSVGGVPNEQVDVVLAIHGGATVGVLNNQAYRERFGVDNPNLEILRELKEKGVRLTVCGQSLVGREIATKTVNKNVEIATSMLTTVAMYQMRGFSLIKF